MTQRQTQLRQSSWCQETVQNPKTKARDASLTRLKEVFCNTYKTTTGTKLNRSYGSPESLNSFSQTHFEGQICVRAISHFFRSGLAPLPRRDWVVRRDGA